MPWCTEPTRHVWTENTYSRRYKGGTDATMPSPTTGTQPSLNVMQPALYATRRGIMAPPLQAFTHNAEITKDTLGLLWLASHKSWNVPQKKQALCRKSLLNSPLMVNRRWQLDLFSYRCEARPPDLNSVLDLFYTLTMPGKHEYKKSRNRCN